MTQKPQPDKSSSTVWFVLLAGAVIVSAGFLVHTFRQAFAPPDAAVVAQATDLADNQSGVTGPTGPTWSRSVAFQAKQDAQPEITFPAPKLTPAQEEAARREQIRKQAEYLRLKAATNKDPDGVGKLTPEQIAQMEKNGEMAW